MKLESIVKGIIEYTLRHAREVILKRVAKSVDMHEI